MEPEREAMTNFARRTGAALALASALVSWGALADPIGDLNGYWTGGGTVALTNGKTERVKCHVIYRPTDNAGQIRQSMRCASADYSINSLADLRVRGGQVSGSWEEKTYAAKGDVTGRYNAEGFALRIKGANFSAAMNVTLSTCKQSLSISPQGLEVTRVSLALAKEGCGE
jgi:hypothetical protein